jgi:hypothetical protein
MGVCNYCSILLVLSLFALFIVALYKKPWSSLPPLFRKGTKHLLFPDMFERLAEIRSFLIFNKSGGAPAMKEFEEPATRFA